MRVLWNLPSQYTQDMLSEDIHNEGFIGAYDLLHVPFDGQLGTNCGYAVINFVDAGHARMFSKVFEGRRMRGPGSEDRSAQSAAPGSQNARRGGRRRRGGSLIDK